MSQHGFFSNQAFTPKSTRRVAIMLTAHSAKSRREIRSLARKTIPALLSLMALNAAASWLTETGIPVTCKMREIALVPVKLTMFMLGLRREAALLEWRKS
jgi:hypothetical protein